MNTYLFDPTKDKYYAMFLMNMDAKEYTISNYLYQMIKSVDRFLPFTCFLWYECRSSTLDYDSLSYLCHDGKDVY